MRGSKERLSFQVSTLEPPKTYMQSLQRSKLCS